MNSIRRAWRVVCIWLTVLSILLTGLPIGGDVQADTGPTEQGVTGYPRSPVVASGRGDPGSAAISPTLGEQGWWTAAQEAIRRSEYRITWQDRTYLADLPAAYQAPNRAQGLRTYFTPTGIRVIPRTTATPAWEWGLALTGYGHVGDVRPLAQAEPTPNANRIEYRRPAFGVTEWYVNDERGLEQGFTLMETGSASEGEIVLQLTIAGDLTAKQVDGGSAIEFTAPDGARVLRYADLYAYDATGRDLPSWFTLTGAQLAIHVDDTDALYPITVDPLVTTPGWTAESEQAEAQLGISASTAGDVNGDGYADVVIGASLYDNGQTDEGRVYVYYGSASGLSATPAWTAEGDQSDARFGRSVSTAGDVNGDGYVDVIIGADRYDGGQTDEGRAYVYHGSASGLSTTPAWTVESDQADAYLGACVSTAGDVNGDGYSDVIVGAGFYDGGGTDTGKVWVFHGSASGLSATADWTVVGDQADALLGFSVSTAGDVNGDGYADVIVGAQDYDNGEQDEGRAYVYHGSATGLGSTPVWTVEGNQAGVSFGHAVGAAGDVNGDGYADVVIGAHHYDGGETDEGRALVYYGSATGLSTAPDWTAESDQANAEFGGSVGTAGDVNGDGYADVIVGAYLYDGGQVDEGRAYVYHGSASGLSATADWTAESDQDNARFGWWVAAAGDVDGDGYAEVVVGAPWYTNGQTKEGRAYVYHGSADGLDLDAGWTTEGEQAEARYGTSVGTAGDVNGDGYADLLVGARWYDNGQTDEGRVFVYYGSAGGLSTTADWMAEGDQTGAEFGHWVSTAGDVNGDGYADVVIGSHTYDNGENDEGRAYVYHGSASGLSPTADWITEGDQDGAHYGNSVSTAGDVNGDGYADVVVGSLYYDNGETDEGRAYVYYGSETGLSATADWVTEGNQDGAYYGHLVSTAGDVNGDGYSDVIVSATWYDNGETDEGRAYVYYGSETGLSTTPDWAAEGDQDGAWFGRSVNTAGDVNGDGYADIIVGAAHYDNGEQNEGRAYVYHGSATGLHATADWTAEGNQVSAQFATAADTAGDVNGDGYADVVVAAWGYSNGQTSEGRVYLYHGSASGLSATADWTAEGNQAYANFGASVGTAGDVNGDGYADLVVGASQYDNGESDEGRVLVYYGNGGQGLSLNPRQRRSDDGGPVAHLGRSERDAFRLALLGRTPFGRGKVKMEWEVKPLGTPFDGADTQQSAAWLDTGTAGAEIGELVAGLSVDTAYHWRVRLRYHPAATPFQQYSRWLTMPWDGWNEADLRTGEFAVPQADLSAAPLSGAVPLAVQFTDLSTGNVDAWLWAFGDGDTSAEQHPAHTYTQTGDFTVTLTVSGALGSDVVVKANYIHVTPQPPAAPTLLPIANADYDGDYTVEWSDVPSATTYTLQEDDNAAFANPSVVYQGAAGQHAVTGQADGSWYYRVRASDGGQDSAWSNVESVWVGEPPSVPGYDLLHNAAPSSAGWTVFDGQGVNVVFGNYVRQYGDLYVAGRGLPVLFGRTYNSGRTGDGPLGYGWTHSYAMTVTQESATTVLVRNPDGRLDRYTATGGGDFEPPPGVYTILRDDGDGSYSLEDKSQTVYDFDAAGRLMTITDRNDNRLTFAYTGDRLTTITDTVSRTFTLDYDGQGHLVQVSDPASRTVQYDYNAAGELVRFTDANGQETTFGYDALHRLVTATDANGHVQVINQYDAAGRVERQTDAAGYQTTFAYASTIRQTSVTGGRGNTTIYAYDAGYRVVSQQDPLGYTLTTDYDDHNNLIASLDKRGYRTSFGYDSMGNVTAITDSLGYTVTLTYDARNNPTRRTDPLGRQTTFGYDALGNLTVITDALGLTTAFAYDGHGQVTELTDAEGRTTALSYDDQGNLTGIVDALANTTGLSYDQVGRMVGLTDARNGQFGYTYDAEDRPTVVTDALGFTTHYTYDAVGNLLSETDPQGRTTSYTYDERDLLLTVTDALGHITTYQYDANGDRTAVTDPLGNTTSYQYDALNRLVRVEDALGQVTRYEYDANGNRTAVTDPLGRSVRYRYDALNRLTSVTDPLGHATHYEYDAVGNRTAVVDATGQRTAYAYDALDRLATVTDALGGQVSYGYDGVGNRTSVTGPRGSTTGYTYDDLNRLVRVTDPLSNTTAYAYDALGNRTVMTDALGLTTTYRYDAMSRQVQVVYPDQVVEYAYDAVGNRVTMTDTTGVTTYTYDALNRLQSVTDPQGRTTSYAYDAAGNRTEITYPNGQSVTYAYDAAHRLTRVTDWQGGAAHYLYDAAGNQMGLLYPNDVAGVFQYDAAGRLTLMQYLAPDGETLLSIAYAYDALGNRTQMTDDEGLTVYGYDGLSRLTSVTYPDGETVQYAYDAAGNRTAMTSTVSGALTYTYDAADRLLSISDGTTFTWDAKGNMLSKGDVQYTYDAANRLTQVLTGTTRVEFAYDGDGRRTMKSVDGFVTRYVWDIAAPLPVIVAETEGQYETAYTYGGGLLSMIQPSGLPAYYHADGLGSVRRLSDVGGESIDSYAYDAFGQLRIHLGSTAQPFTFSGGQIDNETELLYLRSRYYDFSVGRFLQPDSLDGSPQYSQTWNKYSYVYNNPIRITDPMGYWGINIQLNIGVVGGVFLGGEGSFGAGPELEFPSWNPLDWRFGLGGGSEIQVAGGPHAEGSVKESLSVYVWDRSQPIPGASDAPLTTCAGGDLSAVVGIGAGVSTAACTGEGKTGVSVSVSGREGGGGGAKGFVSVSGGSSRTWSLREAWNSVSSLYNRIFNDTNSPNRTYYIMSPGDRGTYIDIAFASIGQILGSIDAEQTAFLLSDMNLPAPGPSEILNHVTSLTFDPESPSDADPVMVHVTADGPHGIARIRVLVNTAADGSESGDWNVAFDLPGSDVTGAWNTAGYDQGIHKLRIEAIEPGDDGWTHPARDYALYALLPDVSSGPVEGIWVCRDADYHNCQEYKADVAQFGGPTLFDNQASSIRVGAGYTAILHSDPNYTGTAEQFIGDDPNLSDNGIGNDTASSMRVYQNAGVTLFEHADYHGVGQTFSNDVADLSGTTIGNDRASSIWVRGDLIVTLYTDANFQGTAVVFTEDDPDLSDNGINDQVSSLKITSPNGVTLFQDDNYHGLAETFVQDDPDLSDNPIGDNTATSIKVSPGYIAVVNAGPNYTDTAEQFDADDPDLTDNGIGNDTISSIRVLDAPGLTLFQDGNYKGQAENLQASDPDLSDNLIGDDTATSLKVRGDYVVTVYSEPNYAGQAETFRGDDANLLDNLIGDNAISSVQIGFPPGVTLLEKENYLGRAETFVGDDPDLRDNYIEDNKTRSIRLTGEYIADLYPEVNYGGTPERFVGSDPNLGDNPIGNLTVSSIRVYPVHFDAANASTPTALDAVWGRPFSITLTFSNTGDIAWLASQDVKLGLFAYSDLMGVPATRWELDPDESVAPGATRSWTVPFTAPNAPGVYWQMWQMVREDGQVGRFGELLVLQITVSPPEPGGLARLELSEPGWDFGTASQGRLLHHTFSLVSTGLADLEVYLNNDHSAVSLSTSGLHTIAAGDFLTVEVTIDTALLPVGGFGSSITIQSNDSQNPGRTLDLSGTVAGTGAETQTSSVAAYRPWDRYLYVGGTLAAGQVVTFSHLIDTDPPEIQPLYAYSQDRSELLGIGEVVPPELAGAMFPGSLFGSGQDGDLTVTGNTYVDDVRTSVDGTAGAGQRIVPVASTASFAPGQDVLIIQMQGNGAGNYELHTIESVGGNSLTLSENLAHTYTDGGPYGVTLYRAKNYDAGDFSERFVTGFHRLDHRAIGNDTVSSLTVNGYRLKLYKDIEYGGTEETFTADDPDLSNNPIGDDAASSMKINRTATSHSAQVIRVPQYRTVHIAGGGVLQAHDWDGETGGVLCFKALEVQVDAGGRIDVSGADGDDEGNPGENTVGGGFRGGGTPYQSHSDFYGCQGESTDGFGNGGVDGSWWQNNGSGGGGGIERRSDHSTTGGGGGGHAVAGNDSAPADPGGDIALGGAAIGQPELTQLYLGAGGGGAGMYAYRAGSGGSGGGIVYILARRLAVAGNIAADGGDGGFGGIDWSNGGGGGGGGAGGSVKIVAHDATLGANQVTALKGLGGDGSYSHGGDGSPGRIRVEYGEMSGSTNPAASTQYTEFFDLRAATDELVRFRLSQAVSGWRRYWVQFGQSGVYTGAGDHLFHVRLPRRAYEGATLDVMLTDAALAPDSVALTLDVGDDGSTDWTAPTLTQVPTNVTTADWSAALNAYLETATPDPDGTVVVPIRVALNCAGELLLTNLVATPGPEVDLMPDNPASDPGQPVAGEVVSVSVTLHNLGDDEAQNIVLTLYDGDPASSGQELDHSFLPSLAGPDARPVYFAWDTTGYTGTYTLTVVADPLDRLAELDEGNNETELVVEVQPDDSLGPVIGSPVYSATVVSNRPLTVTAVISDGATGDHGVSQATLFYGYAMPYNQAQVSGSGPGGNGDGLWTFALPPQGDAHEGQTVHFSLTAEDNDASPAISVENNGGNYYTVSIGDDDAQPPAISHPLPLDVDAGESITFTVTVTDPSGVSAPVSVTWSSGAFSGTVALTLTQGSRYRAVSAIGPFSACQKVVWRVWAEDGDNSPAGAWSTPYTTTVYLPGDFDRDGDIDATDIMQIADHWQCQAGDACYEPLYDRDGDGGIDVVDIMQVARRWQESCTWNRASAQEETAQPPRTATAADRVVRPALAPDSDVTLRISPTLSLVGSGDAFTVTAIIEDVADLGAFEVGLAYSSSVVLVDRMELGPFPPTTERTWVELGPVVDGDTGIATYGAFSYGSQVGPTGTGVIAITNLTAQSPGTTTLHLTNTLVLDADANPQTLLLGADGTVSVWGSEVTLSGPTQRTGLPGAVVTHTFAVTNTGSSTDTFDLDIMGSTWPVTLSMTRTEALGAGRSAPISVQVRVPTSTLASTLENDVFTLTVTSGRDPGAFASTTGTTYAIHPGVALSGDTMQYGLPGAAIVHTLTVTNTGDYTDSFTLNITGGWPVTPSFTETPHLPPDGWTTLLVTVSVPPGVAPGNMARSVLTATSRFDPGVYDDATLVTVAYREGYWIYLPLILRASGSE